MVTSESFPPGRFWTWEYREESGRLFSEERYQVIARDGDWVWLEMATRFDSAAPFHPHHRLRVNLARCREAYRSPREVRVWSFEMFSRNGSTGGWEPHDPGSTRAFEEKFNCDGFVRELRDRHTVFANGMFQHRRAGRTDGSWFLLEGPHAGVMGAKEMGHGPGHPVYRIELRDSGVE